MCLSVVPADKGVVYKPNITWNIVEDIMDEPWNWYWLYMGATAKAVCVHVCLCLSVCVHQVMP